MKSYQRITAQERDKIAYWVAIDVSYREIGRRLHRSHSTISDEVRRNRVNGIYGSIEAHRASEKRKRACRKKYLLRTRPGLQAHVLEKLHLDWSPEQIAGRLKKEIGEGKRSAREYINHESIYQYIYDEAQRAQKLWECLPRSHQKRKRWLGRRSRSVKIPQRVSIRHRPEEVSLRTQFGHWEGDTVVGLHHKSGIHTEVERLSRLLFAQVIPRIRAQETYVAQLCIFDPLPRQARQSTTLDNGSENYLHTMLRKELGMDTYFSDPFSSWQRGSNEYANGLIRRYFPKRTDFRWVRQEDLNEVVRRLNQTPRKVLGYKTPFEVFTTHLYASGRIDS